MFEIIGKQYPFSFYLIIFLECFFCEVTFNHLMKFNYDKIEEPEYLEPIKLNQIKNFLRVLEKYPDKILKYVNEEENKKKCLIKIYSIILYFNYFFDKAQFTCLLYNEEIKEGIYLGLLINKELFQDIKLTKEQIGNFISILTDFNQISISLSYTKSIYELLQIIENNFKKIVELYKKEELKSKEKNNNIINLDKLGVPNPHDNLEEISKYI